MDVLKLHTPEKAVYFDASLDKLALSREQGQIRHIGLSNVTREHIDRARKIVPIASVQNRYGFADRECDYVVNYCAENRSAFIPWAPLGSGKRASES